MRRPASAIHRDLCGMTLIEMLVATAATLLLMAAVAQVFSVFGTAVSGNRDVLALDSRLRVAAWRLRADLEGATARLTPPRSPDSGEGYFEIIEGPLTDFVDATTSLTLVNQATPVGPTDIDDALLFTTRSAHKQFIGRVSTGIMESPVAEVAWFARATPGATNPVTYTLYRKQLLVMGYVGAGPFETDNKVDFASYVTWAAFYQSPFDLSVRREQSPTGAFDILLPNSLSDLTRRESRFMHNTTGLTDTGFPFGFVNHQELSISTASEELPASLDGLLFDSTSPRYGEDVVIENVLAFDVRVFDPAAPVLVTASTALVPGDPGFTNAPAAPAASGGYVDLGHSVTSNPLITGIVPQYSGFGDPISKLDGSITLRRTYDTWSNHYEADGRDSDSDGLFDEGTDGLDNDGDNLIDEPDEAETAPPYRHALRGIEVRIRCYEPTSRQVRQVTVRHTFVPH
jgi:type II secretory pathway component PulJ